MKQYVEVVYNVFLNKYVIRVKEEYNNGSIMLVARDGKNYNEVVKAIKQVVSISDNATITYKVNDNGKWSTSTRVGL